MSFEGGFILLEPLTYAYRRRIIISERGENMKTKDLIELLEKNGWKFKRHGANHDIYVKGTERESIVRHKETDEELAKAIIKRRGLK
jgi:mRNA interferase HicA